MGSLAADLTACNRPPSVASFAVSDRASETEKGRLVSIDANLEERMVEN
jgi:hypothetical protein